MQIRVVLARPWIIPSLCCVPQLPVITRLTSGNSSQGCLLASFLRNSRRLDWPPDLEGAASRLTDRFVALRATGRTEQSPAYLWFRGWRATTEKTFSEI